MRHYETDSASAAGRILALCMVVDGNLAPAELRALQRTRLLEFIDIDIDTFHDLLSDLCHDMLSTSVKHEHVVLDIATIDALLGEIRAPELRRELLRAMWIIADADGVLADAEARLLARACTVWSAESRFVKQEAQELAQD
ncbi:TerB family tellurite resistance protein [Pseudoduganella danionis]|uniref:TerB family tellurite resistance protein n=1 Tax=Pseudoduganella danionis TaxID=1890295 RepID=A0ABW9SSQ8_9BURK|nr:TerB family tellurite resistance protein [Pseudoduganella danionis]MTW35193.1 TerB family tellurite resistance protein [Pseudoduganella danionis]